MEVKKLKIYTTHQVHYCLEVRYLGTKIKIYLFILRGIPLQNEAIIEDSVSKSDPLLILH